MGENHKDQGVKHRPRKLLRSVSYEDGVRRQSKRWEEDRP